MYAASGGAGAQRAGFIGRVFTSFPLSTLNGGLQVFAVNENAADHEAGKKINVNEKHGARHNDKSAEAPHRTSIDMLRVTLNLARGNIEDQSVVAARAPRVVAA